VRSGRLMAGQDRVGVQRRPRTGQDKDKVSTRRRPRTGQDKDKVGARRRPRTGQDKDKRVVGGGLRFFIGEQGNKQVVA